MQVLIASSLRCVVWYYDDICVLLALYCVDGSFFWNFDFVSAMQKKHCSAQHEHLYRVPVTRSIECGQIKKNYYHSFTIHVA
jgi:hypothetical protein